MVIETERNFLQKFEDRLQRIQSIEHEVQRMLGRIKRRSDQAASQTAPLIHEIENYRTVKQNGDLALNEIQSMRRNQEDIRRDEQLIKSGDTTDLRRFIDSFDRIIRGYRIPQTPDTVAGHKAIERSARVISYGFRALEQYLTRMYDQNRVALAKGSRLSVDALQEIAMMAQFTYSSLALVPEASSVLDCIVHEQCSLMSDAIRPTLENFRRCEDTRSSLSLRRYIDEFMRLTDLQNTFYRKILPDDTSKYYLRQTVAPIWRQCSSEIASVIEQGRFNISFKNYILLHMIEHLKTMEPYDKLLSDIDVGEGDNVNRNKQNTSYRSSRDLAAKSFGPLDLLEAAESNATNFLMEFKGEVNLSIAQIGFLSNSAAVESVTMNIMDRLSDLMIHADALDHVLGSSMIMKKRSDPHSADSRRPSVIYCINIIETLYRGLVQKSTQLHKASYVVNGSCCINNLYYVKRRCKGFIIGDEIESILRPTFEKWKDEAINTFSQSTLKVAQYIMNHQTRPRALTNSEKQQVKKTLIEMHESIEEFIQSTYFIQMPYNEVRMILIEKSSALICQPYKVLCDRYVTTL